MTRHAPLARVMALVLALVMALSSVVAVSAQQQDQQQQQQNPNDLQVEEGQNQQLQEERRQIQEELQQVERQLQRAEQRNTPQREIRQLEREQQQLQQELQQVEQQLQQAGQQGQQVQLRELLRNTDNFFGEDVTVSGEIGQELTRVAFTLTATGSNREILVIGDSQVIPRNPRDNVVVSGVVHESFNISEVADELGVQLNEEALSTFEGQPYIFADRVGDARQETNLQADDDPQQIEQELQQIEDQIIRVEAQLQEARAENAPRREIRQLERELAQLEQQQRQLERQLQQAQQGQAEQGEIVTLREVLRNTDRYFDDFVSVSGTVGEQLSSAAFTLTTDGREILVVGGNFIIPDNLPDQVRVDGLVQESFDPTDIDTALHFDLDEDALQEFAGEPFIQASRLRDVREQDDQQAQAEQVSLREVIRNTDQYVGQTVEVTGEVNTTPVPFVYELETDGLQIVMMADPQIVPANDQGQVTVIGTVRQFSVDELVQAVDIQVPRTFRSFLQDFGPIGAIVAERVLPETEAGGEPGQPIDVVNVADILETPADFADQVVTIRGRRGQELGRGAFVVTQGGEEIIVVGNRQVIPRNVPRNVQVTGQVQEDFNIQEVEEQTGLPLDDQQAADFEGMPFVIAEDVRNAQETPSQPEVQNQQP